MGIYDRDYMKSNYSAEKKKSKEVSFYKKMMFFLWRIKRRIFKSTGPK
jgi:hypothetical protein